MSIELAQPINQAALQRLLSYCHRRRYPARVTLMKPTDRDGTFFYVAEGSLTVSAHDQTENQDIVLAYLNKGDFIGEVGVFLGPMMRHVTVTTREPSQLAEIGYARLHQLLRRELADCAVDILLLIGRQLAHRLLSTSRKVERLAFYDVTRRIVHTLEDLCQQPNAMTHPDGMQIRVTRQEIGRIVGCSREMAGKVLKNLAAEGLISVSGKTIVVYGAR